MENSFRHRATRIRRLESFTRAAILKTVDGGESWTRVEVNDPQGNANLEGVGFLDENTGWVGGWGSADLPKGSPAPPATAAGPGRMPTKSARFINRFRFFRDIPIGYASGLTVYKYSAEPVRVPPCSPAGALSG